MVDCSHGHNHRISYSYSYSYSQGHSCYCHAIQKDFLQSSSAVRRNSFFLTPETGSLPSVSESEGIYLAWPHGQYGIWGPQQNLRTALAKLRLAAQLQNFLGTAVRTAKLQNSVAKIKRSKRLDDTSTNTD